MRSPSNDGASGSSASRLPILVVGAIGVVYGDIGTSPLYTMREAFGLGGLPLGEATVLGVLSLVFWALFVVVTIKYVAVIMQADNQGQGGVLALATLALRGLRAGGRGQRLAIVLAMVGAALFYGDGIITPAISVLSAIEGLKVATPAFEPYVVPIALAILVVLFLVQRRGTGGVGKLFGPLMCIWFATLAVLGLSGRGARTEGAPNAQNRACDRRLGAFGRVSRQLGAHVRCPGPSSAQLSSCRRRLRPEPIDPWRVSPNSARGTAARQLKTHVTAMAHEPEADLDVDLAHLFESSVLSPNGRDPR